jgi:8-oxo-dGTP pyrophosphatase MutT (NUDIX family)
LRRSKNSALEVLLITSRDTGRWIVPKGWPSKGLKDHKMAAREAEEEAGAVGDITSDPAGSFVYLKRLTRGTCKSRGNSLRAARAPRNGSMAGEESAYQALFQPQGSKRRVQAPELQAHIKNAKKLFAAHP